MCHSYVDSFVDKAMLLKMTPSSQRKNDDELNQAEDANERRNFFVNELAQSTEDRDKIRVGLLNILIAGRDTVASLLSNMFHVLSRRPAIWNKVKNEVRQLGTDTPTFEQLHSLKYARACINETLRLYPPIPSNTRVAVRDTVLPRGSGPLGDDPIFVAKGTTVVYSVYAMHRRRDIFGDDADNFRPERWENNDKHGWDYLPFNEGPRVCLGQQYAITEALMVLACFAQEFESIKARDPHAMDGESNVDYHSCWWHQGCPLPQAWKEVWASDLMHSRTQLVLVDGG